MYTSNSAWSYDQSMRTSNHRYTSCLPKKVRKIILLLAFLTVSITSLVISIELIKQDVPGSENIKGSFIVNTIILKLTTSSILCFLYGFFWEESQEITSSLIAFIPIITFTLIDFVVDGSTEKLTESGIDTVRLYMVCVGTPIVAILSKWATSTFSCRRIVGAGDILLNMYQSRCRLQSYMRLDLQLLILLGLLGFGIGTAKENTKYVVVSVMIIFAVLKWIIGNIAIKREMKGLVALFVSLSTLGNLWIPIQLILVSCFDSARCNSSRLEYSWATLATSIFVILSQVHVYISLMKVYRNFGYGLTDRGFVRLVTESTSLLSDNQRRTLNCG